MAFDCPGCSAKWTAMTSAFSGSAASVPAPASPEYEDCLGCRVTGSATLLGVSAYFFNERSKLPRKELGQRRWLLACCGAFALGGVWRATTGLFDKPIDKQQPSKD